MRCFKIKKGTEWTEDKIYEAMEFIQNYFENVKVKNNCWTKDYKIIIETNKK